MREKFGGAIHNFRQSKRVIGNLSPCMEGAGNGRAVVYDEESGVVEVANAPAPEPMPRTPLKKNMTESGKLRYDSRLVKIDFAYRVFRPIFHLSIFVLFRG